MTPFSVGRRLRDPSEVAPDLRVRGADPAAHHRARVRRGRQRPAGEGRRWLGAHRAGQFGHHGRPADRLVVHDVVGLAGRAALQGDDRRRHRIVEVDPRQRPGRAQHRDLPLAKHLHHLVVARTDPVDQSVAQGDPFEVRVAEDQLLVHAHRGEVGLEPAGAAGRERVLLGVDASAGVVVPVAEQHRLGEEPAGTEVACHAHQVARAGVAKTIGGVHVAVEERGLAQLGQLVDHRVGLRSVQGPAQGVPVQHVGGHRSRAQRAQPAVAAVAAGQCDHLVPGLEQLLGEREADGSAGAGK